jgi:hypothetical protein
MLIRMVKPHTILKKVWALRVLSLSRNFGELSNLCISHLEFAFNYQHRIIAFVYVTRISQSRIFEMIRIHCISTFKEIRQKKQGGTGRYLLHSLPYVFLNR